MRFVVLDFETYFADDYTLSKMSTEAYIRDPRFQAHGTAIKWSPNEPAQWYEERRLRQVLKDEDWSDVFLINHHAQFDSLILSHHFSVVPRMYACTLSMARLLLGNHISVSLDSVRKQFGLPAKSTPYNLFKNKHWNELDPNTQRLIGEGACDEVESIWTLFNILGKDFPTAEYETVDSIIRMFVQPVLRGDLDVLANLWTSENTRKQQRLAELNVTEADLQSAERFAALLREEGVEPQKKISPKQKEIYAFAKTDDFMRGLLEHDNERVQTLAEARLGVKSTILQTRAETLGWMARRGSLSVYLRYAGAGTLRPSGGDGCLTADTKVLTLDVSGTIKYKQIVDVQLSDLVWDGEEFVEHEGVAFSGYQQVVSWDGISGTPNHKVCCGKTWKELGEALRTKTPILDCGEPTAWQVEASRARQRSRT